MRQKLIGKRNLQMGAQKNAVCLVTREKKGLKTEMRIQPEKRIRINLSKLRGKVSERQEPRPNEHAKEKNGRPRALKRKEKRKNRELGK